MKTVLIAAAALTASAAAAPASAAEVEIRNAVARVVVIVEDRRDVAVEVTQGRAGLPTLQVRRQGRDVRIDGGLRRTGFPCGNRSVARQVWSNHVHGSPWRYALFHRLAFQFGLSALRRNESDWTAVYDLPGPKTAFDRSAPIRGEKEETDRYGGSGLQ